jgi:hypothetical protein
MMLEGSLSGQQNTSAASRLFHQLAKPFITRISPKEGEA